MTSSPKLSNGSRGILTGSITILQNLGIDFDRFRAVKCAVLNRLPEQGERRPLGIRPSSKRIRVQFHVSLLGHGVLGVHMLNARFQVIPNLVQAGQLESVGILAPARSLGHHWSRGVLVRNLSLVRWMVMSPVCRATCGHTILRARSTVNLMDVCRVFHSHSLPVASSVS